MVLYGRPDDWVVPLKRRTETRSTQPARSRPRPLRQAGEALTWVVVGDLSKIEAGIRARTWAR
jgi:zinc protease